MNPLSDRKALATIVSDEVTRALGELDDLRVSLTLIIDRLTDASEKAAELADSFYAEESREEPRETKGEGQ